MRKYALLFPGQGAQYTGMGKSFSENDPDANQIYLKASKNLHVDMKAICFEENDLIKKTEYAQKAIFVTTAAIYEAFQNMIDELPYALVGFSLGEYSAMYASGMICLENMLRLIDARSKWMEEATKEHPGAMAALIGGDIEAIEALCMKITDDVGYLQIANYNSPVQKVLSGTNEAITYLENNFHSTGAKRCVRLNVSGPFHTPFMAKPAKQMKELVKTIGYKTPVIPIVANATGEYLKSSEVIDNIERQIQKPVRFEDSIRYLINQGIDLFIEIGPGTVLTGLVKKIDPEVQTISINEYDDLHKLEELL